VLFLQDSHYFFLGWSSSFRVPARVGWRLLSIEMSSNLVSYFKTAFSPKRHVNTQKKKQTQVVRFLAWEIRMSPGHSIVAVAGPNKP